MESDHFPMKNPHLTARPFPICDNLPENWHLKSFNLFLWAPLLNLIVFFLFFFFYLLSPLSIALNQLQSSSCCYLHLPGCTEDVMHVDDYINCMGESYAL